MVLSMVNRNILDEIDEMQKGWVDMIKSAVKATADLRLWKNGEPGPIDVLRVLGQMNKESKIPLNVIFSWWKAESGQYANELTCLKCSSAPRQLCHNHRGNRAPYIRTQESHMYGLCVSCARKQQKGRARK